MPEVTRKASLIVTDLERFLAGGRPEYPRIAAAHGWPDPDKVRANIAALKPLRDLTVTFDLPTGTIPQEPAMTQPAPTPTPPPTRTITATTTPPDAITALLDAANNHDKLYIRKRAQKIDADLKSLSEALKADREDAARRAEIANLEAKLAELKAASPKRAAAQGDFPCGVAGCEARFTTKQGVTLHNTRSHRAAS